MRKHQTKQILEILQTIGEAQAARLYADCQEGAQSIAEFIDEMEGEGTRTAALLYEYCNLVTRLINGQTGDDVLRRQLREIEDSVKEELKPNRIEIAFLSYKASMSDSIESIYLAAKADPDVDAYWIPIPYFERNADGSLGQMLFEGADHYGEDIVCTDWRMYDISARRPDVIVTFAPYDGRNRVTSVYPDFYCERIRNLTDLLVYVPYFVVADDVAEHFCTVPGCVFAHRVLLQSERLRSTYMRAFTKQYGNRFGDPKEKFVVMGSPKYDKALLTKRADCPLPPEWERLIAGRKVVFYNSTIAAVLSGNEQYLEGLRASLEVFRKSSDVALWWRPHPLNDATYRSMRPHLFNEYRQIIDDYRCEGWGIYDDTSDLHRALAWADACYGDMSSIVALFYATGKPVLINTLDENRSAGSKTSNLHGKDPASISPAGLEATVDESGQIYCETHSLPLPAFIQMLVQDSPALKRLGQRGRESFLRLNANADGTAGAKILEYCKGYVGLTL
jgi:hypothetical protein